MRTSRDLARARLFDDFEERPQRQGKRQQQRCLAQQGSTTNDTSRSVSGRMKRKGSMTSQLETAVSRTLARRSRKEQTG